MKVDTQRMEEAYSQMTELQRYIAQIGHEILEIRSVLYQQQFGSSEQNEMISSSLLKQSQVLDQREEGIGLLANMLQSAMEQYQRCETEVRQNIPANTGNKYHISLEKLNLFCENIRLVAPNTENQIIQKYLKPLMRTGKKETT